MSITMIILIILIILYVKSQYDIYILKQDKNNKQLCFETMKKVFKDEQALSKRENQRLLEQNQELQAKLNTRKKKSKTTVKTFNLPKDKKKKLDKECKDIIKKTIK